MKKESIHYHPVAAAIKVALCGSLLISTSLLAQQTTDAVAEKKAEDAAVEKIVVIGARGAPRSVGDSAVPELPMPNANRLACCRLRRISSNTSRSTVT